MGLMSTEMLSWRKEENQKWKLATVPLDETAAAL